MKFAFSYLCNAEDSLTNSTNRIALKVFSQVDVPAR